MTPQEIKDALKAKGYSQNALARKWDKPACTISALVNQKFKSRRMEKRLARLLGVTLEVLRAPDEEIDHGADSSVNKEAV